MGVTSRAGSILLVAGLLGACASELPKSREFVVLVPDNDGKVGAVVITSSQGKSTLDKPYTAARYEDGGKIETAPVAREEVRTTFAIAINVAGRGEREPIVPTADEVSEPRNRRVEINVR